MLDIIDNTLRDGSYAVNFQITAETTRRVVEGLDLLGFRYIEVGHGMGLGASRQMKGRPSPENDLSYIMAARQAAKRAKIGCFFIPGIGDRNDILLAKEQGLDFIRIGTDILQYEKAQSFAEYAKEQGLKVMINLLKSYQVRPYEFARIAREVSSWEIADSIYLVDSAGCMLPDEVFEYINRTRELTETPLGFHGHNNLSMAVANSMKAAEAGAKYVDACLRGWGRSAGNAQTEILVHLLQNRGFMTTEIDQYHLYEFVNQHILPLMPQDQGLSDEDIHTGINRFHSSYMEMAENASRKFGVDKKRIIQGFTTHKQNEPSQEFFNQIAQQILQ